ncbi:type VII toxin-antitoxin system MntA family adenylyltransferase antitoxin [Pseudonocardia zijingensis]|uniref:Polymerase beta nucleotidyltransferase domain-containing protein n=1 Tax=Pseudonocardia zijingensis TaxID=153376 RepID=A0ABP4A4X3_9PSEU
MTPEQKIVAQLHGHPAMTGVQVLVLHGSRARGEEGPASDWDFGVLTDGTADLAGLSAALTDALVTDAVDVVDLRRASALLRYRAARDGVVLVERREGAFREFQLEAVQFWCDAGPIIRAAQDDVLAAL